MAFKNNKKLLILGALGITIIGATIFRDTLVSKFVPELYLAQAAQNTLEITKSATNQMLEPFKIDFLSEYDNYQYETNWQIPILHDISEMLINRLNLSVYLQMFPNQYMFDVLIEEEVEIFALDGYIIDDEVGIRIEDLDDNYFVIKGKTFAEDYNNSLIRKTLNWQELDDSYRWDGIIAKDREIDWSPFIEIGTDVVKQISTSKKYTETVYGEDYQVFEITLDEANTKTFVTSMVDEIFKLDDTEVILGSLVVMNGKEVRDAYTFVKEMTNNVPEYLKNATFGEGLTLEVKVDESKVISGITLDLPVNEQVFTIAIHDEKDCIRWNLSMIDDEQCEEIEIIMYTASTKIPHLIEIENLSNNVRTQEITIATEYDDELTYFEQIWSYKNLDYGTYAIEYKVNVDIDEENHEINLDLEKLNYISNNIWTTDFTTVTGDITITPIVETPPVPTDQIEIFKLNFMDAAKLGASYIWWAGKINFQIETLK
ncbi:MAG: hypothetical protein ATN36_01830 [Epulopiscium sp. Nele67-Bin005]|nr:MAG: hypothetical protein ATN36_01830 [Epulopiscium sp. Nele67-Bin005]